MGDPDISKAWDRFESILHRGVIVRNSKMSHLKLFLTPLDILEEFWGHPNPNGSFYGEPERAKMAAKPPFFASIFEIVNY